MIHDVNTIMDNSVDPPYTLEERIRDLILLIILFSVVPVLCLILASMDVSWSERCVPEYDSECPDKYLEGADFKITLFYISSGTGIISIIWFGRLLLYKYKYK